MSYTKIILSGRRNTGKTTLFWALQKQLNWPTFSISQYLRDYIRIYGLQGASATQMAEHEIQMGHDIGQRVMALLKTDYPMIIEARLFEHIRQEWPGALKVLLTADEPVRIKRNAYREGISEQKSAQRLIKKEDKWIKKMEQQFGFGDFYNSDLYDLVIDTTQLSKDQVAARVLDLVLDHE